MKKVILTGVSGQDGSYMAEYLLAQGNYIVIGATRRTSQLIDSNIKHLLENPNFRIASFDLCDVHSITSLIQNENPDYFINFGAQTFVSDSWNTPALHLQTNAVALVHILEAVRKFCPSCRVYSAGSSEQWGDVKYNPQDEKHPMSPRSIYGVSKCAASHICKVYRESYGLYVVHGILCNHESERRQDYFVTRKITKGVARIKKALENNKPFEPIQLGNVESQRDWSHAEDFIDGIWKMLHQEEYRKTHTALDNQNSEPPIKDKNWLKEYVLSSGETHTIREFVEKAFKYAGIEGCWINGQPLGSIYDPLKDVFAERQDDGAYPLLVQINPKFFRPAEVEILLGDSSLIREELGWKPKVSFDELVKRMVLHDIGLLN